MSAARLVRQEQKDQQDRRARKAMMDDPHMKLPFKPGLLVVSPTGLKVLLARQARKVNEAYRESVGRKENGASVENAENQAQQTSWRQLLGRRNLLAILMTLFKVCLWSLGTALAIVGLFVLYAILFQN